jgi:hypothetical protein
MPFWLRNISLSYFTCAVLCRCYVTIEVVFNISIFYTLNFEFEWVFRACLGNFFF